MRHSNLHRRTGIHSLVAAMSLASSAYSLAGDCTLLENGSFSDDDAGWTLEQNVDSDGDGQSTATWTIATDVAIFPWFDDDVMALETTVFATGEERLGFGFASASSELSRTIVVTQPTLQFTWGGVWEALYAGEPDVSYVAELNVIAPDGTVHEIPLQSESFGATPNCFIGLSILGFFGSFESQTVSETDLTSLGNEDGGHIALGDTVDIVIRFSAQVNVPDTCGNAFVGGQLLVDDISLCGEGMRGGPDLDGDGVVGPADLAALLGAWGRCPGCPADLDGDGTVGPADLAALLGAWG